MNEQVKHLAGTPALGRPRFMALRRWWIEVNLPRTDADLTVDEWDELGRRYVAAGGKAERFDALIEHRVKEA